jgi:hypothetical protein
MVDMKLNDLIEQLKPGAFVRRAAWSAEKFLRFHGNDVLFYNSMSETWETRGPTFEVPSGVLKHADGTADDWEEAKPTAIDRR